MHCQIHLILHRHLLEPKFRSTRDLQLSDSSILVAPEKYPVSMLHHPQIRWNLFSNRNPLLHLRAQLEAALVPHLVTAPTTVSAGPPNQPLEPRLLRLWRLRLWRPSFLGPQHQRHAHRHRHQPPLRLHQLYRHQDRSKPRAPQTQAVNPHSA